VLATSDEAIRARTGRGWQEWFDLLDGWGAPERSHREIARWVAEQQGIAPLAWNAQAVASSYERARGLRAVGEHPEGFSVTAQKRRGAEHGGRRACAARRCEGARADEGVLASAPGHAEVAA
jgi:hypothetical protein